MPLLLAVMPLKILGYLRPKKGAHFPFGRDALAVLHVCVPFCVAVMPFSQRLALFSGEHAHVTFPSFLKIVFEYL